MDMDISMDIHEKSVDMDMDMDVIFHIHGNPGYRTIISAGPINKAVPSFTNSLTRVRER